MGASGALGGVRYRAVGRASSSQTRLLQPRPPPAGEEESEEDLVEGEPLRGEHQHQPRSHNGLTRGLRSPPIDLARWAVETNQAGGQGFLALLGGGLAKAGAFWSPFQEWGEGSSRSWGR